MPRNQLRVVRLIRYGSLASFLGATGAAGCSEGESAEDSDGASSSAGGMPSSELVAPPNTAPPAEVMAGSPGSATGCAPLAERVRTSHVAVPAPAVPSDEYHPAVIAPFGNGGSLLGFRQMGEARVLVGRLDADDTDYEPLLDLAGEEIHALIGHEEGGALVLMDQDPEIYSDKYCRSEDTPDKAICGKLDLLRFDEKGDTVFRATLTEKKNVDLDGALFLWWYQHTARIAWGGDRYAVYFRSAGSSPRPGDEDKVDIHAGDTLRFVDAFGSRLDGGWGWGCSHSWSVRLAYNGQFGAACHGDGYPNAFRLKILDGAADPTVILHEGTPPAERALGGLVPSSDGFWLSYLQTTDGSLQLHLAHIENSGTIVSDEIVEEATKIDADYVFRPYMARFGEDLLLGWKSAEALHLAVASGEDGSIIEGPVSTDASLDNFVDFVPYPNGDVAWAHSAGGDELSVTRVLACR